MQNIEVFEETYPEVGRARVKDRLELLSWSANQDRAGVERVILLVIGGSVIRLARF